MGTAESYYWAYWGVLFGTLITWVFAVAAAADDAWISQGGYTGLGFETWECYDEDVCDLFEAGKAFQYLATILVSVVLVLVIVAAFMRSPMTGKLGLAAGIGLAVFAVFQLIAFACMAGLAAQVANWDSGPTLGVAVVSWLLGTAGAVVTLVLLRKATTDQDGPFTKCMPKSAGGQGTPGPAEGTV